MLSNTPAEGYAIYDASIDNVSGICGDGSKRVGPQLLTDYLAAFDIGATNYATCHGFHARGQALDIWIYGHAAKQQFADWLTANGSEMARRIGLVQIVWNHQMWRSYNGGPGRPQGGWSSYNGFFHYTLQGGTLVMRETGLTNPPTDDPESGTVMAYQKIVAGTGDFAGATGYLFVSGFNRNQRIVTKVTGQICTPTRVK